MDFDRVSVQSGGVRLFERPGSDIRMTGYLKKLKTMKKKYFVLRSTSSSGPARLEYYDSEKKFNAGHLPKRSIHLHTCFNINRKSDSRHRNSIALYTKEDCFSVICEDDAEQDNWLLQMLEYQNEYVNEGDRHREHYDYVWQVTVQPKGLGQSVNLRGSYRLCMTKYDLFLVKPSMDKPKYIFPLETVRSVAHNDTLFRMEVGKIAPTGEGELWMLTEDSAIAQNLHETVLNSMKYGDRRPEFCDHRRSDSQSLHGSSSSLARPSEFRHRSETFTQGSNRIRPKIERPMSVHTGAARSTSQLHCVVSPGTSPNPHALGFLDHHILGAHRLRSDSNQSNASRTSMSAVSDDLVHDMHSMCLMQPALEEESGFDRPLGHDKQSTLSSPGSCYWVDQDDQDGQGVAYLDMVPGSATTTSVSSNNGYIDMTPVGHKDSREGWPVEQGSAYIPMNPALSSSAPIPIHGGLHGHSAHGEHCTGYMDMAGHSPLPPVKEGGSNDGYLPMSASCNASSVGSSCSGQLKPDRVVCMLSDDGSDFSQPPIRTYSLGSRPAKSGAAHSAYVDMSGRQGVTDNNGRSCSAPHLINHHHQHHHHHHRGGGRNGNVDSPTPSASPLSMSLKSDDSDSFMELDFYRQRTASDGYSYRPRASSFGMPQSSMAQGHRPRSSSHGQGTRPVRRPKMLGRVDSAGRLNHDMLMRSHNSSHGSFDSLKVSSSESLKKLSQEVRSKASQLNTSGYVDMGFEKRLTYSPQPGSSGGSRPGQDSYVDMTLGNRKSSPDLSRMNAKGSSSKVSSLEKTQESDYTSMSVGASSSSAAVSDSVYINLDLREEKGKRMSPPRSSSVENVDAYMMYEPAAVPSNSSRKEVLSKADSATPDPRNRTGSGGKELKKKGFFSMRHAHGGDSGKHGSKKGESSQQGSGWGHSATGGEKFGSLGRDIRQKSKDLSKSVARKSSSFSKTFGINTTKPDKALRKTPTPPKSLDGNDEYVEFAPTASKSDSDSSHSSESMKVSSRSANEAASSREEAVYVRYEPGNIATTSSTPQSTSGYVPMNMGGQGLAFKPVKKSGKKKTKSKGECSHSSSVLSPTGVPSHSVETSHSQSTTSSSFSSGEGQQGPSPSSKPLSSKVTQLVKPVPVYPASNTSQSSMCKPASSEDKPAVKAAPVCSSHPSFSYSSGVHISDSPFLVGTCQQQSLNSVVSAAALPTSPSLSCQPCCASASNSLPAKMPSSQLPEYDYMDFSPRKPSERCSNSNVCVDTEPDSVVMPAVVRSLIADSSTSTTSFATLGSTSFPSLTPTPSPADQSCSVHGTSLPIRKGSGEVPSTASSVVPPSAQNVVSSEGDVTDLGKSCQGSVANRQHGTATQDTDCALDKGDQGPDDPRTKDSQDACVTVTSRDSPTSVEGVTFEDMGADCCSSSLGAAQCRTDPSEPLTSVLSNAKTTTAVSSVKSAQRTLVTQRQ